MNRMKTAQIGLAIETFGIFCVFICIFVDIAVPGIINLLIWIGLAITIFSMFSVQKDIKSKEMKTQKKVLFPLSLLVVLTIVLSFFSK